MKLTYRPYELLLKHPFKVAYGTRTKTDTVLVELEHEGYTGYGEASSPPYLGESTSSVSSFLDKLDSSQLNPLQFQDTVMYLDGVEKGNNAAKAAVDIALHDLLGKMEDKTLAGLMGIDLSKSVQSSYTVAMSAPGELEAKLEDAEDFPIIKLKLGGGNDKELVDRYLDHSSKPYYVDINQGWKEPQRAVDMVNWLTEKGAMFIEQPMPVHMMAETARLTEQSSIPIIAD
ncbi:MAG: dipeptide epimerase, partial [Flavobacteriales bacterium]|nr:dipeptide epimerase [Flavobacteriales bacterium]